jgi:hypothetical protein
MILAGFNRPRIIHFAAENWGIGERATNTYISEAHKRIQSVIEEASGMVFAEHLAARRKLRQDNIGDPYLVFNILRDEAKLLGLYKNDVNVTVKQSPQVQGYTYDSSVAPLAPPEDE